MINCIGMALTALVAVVLRLVYMRLNKRQETAQADQEVGEQRKKFKYML